MSLVRSRPRTLLLRLACVVAAAVTVAGCDVPAPQGAGPMRYRDQVFANTVEQTGITYGSSEMPDGTTVQLAMDRYAPAGDTVTSRPAVIWVHGGSFVTGNRRDSMMVELARRFARRGYVAFSIDYRLTGAIRCSGAESVDACTPAAIDAAYDERMAIRYVRAHAAEFGINPSKIAIGGASAGAIASVLAGASPSARDVGDVKNVGSDVSAVASISGGLPTNVVFHADSPYMLFWHGTADTVVPYAWAVSNSQALSDKGSIGFLHQVSGAGHVPWPQYADDMDRQATYFFFRAMGLWPPLSTRTPAAAAAPAAG